MSKENTTQHVEMVAQASALRLLACMPRPKAQKTQQYNEAAHRLVLPGCLMVICQRDCYAAAAQHGTRITCAEHYIIIDRPLWIWQSIAW